MWVKWRHGYSSGPGEWKWENVGGDKDTDEEMRSYVQNELVPLWEESGEQWSEHYRGVKFELVKVAPKEVIEAKIKVCRTLIEGAARNLAYYEKMLKEA